MNCDHYFVYTYDAPMVKKCNNRTIVNAIFALCGKCGITLDEHIKQSKEDLK